MTADTLLDTVLELARMSEDDLPEHSLGMARLSLFDWLACGRAGVNEPVAQTLRDLAESEGGLGAASIFGGVRAPARMAALANGAASHALDYDDTHFAHVGHLSVGIYPAVIAAAEEVGADLDEVLAAFLLGAEAAIRIGVVLGASHYNRGFHQTATAGAFGATVAAGRLYGLREGQMRAALGLCATRASGLKSQFGTMGKPYNAGVAAANGVECAKLAGMGMTSAADGLMGLQGFVPTHTDVRGPTIPAGKFLFDDVKYKFHACCHGTHAMLEALAESGATDETVAALKLRTNPRWLRVCNIETPQTGLEVKFSYRWLAGMALTGRPTGSDREYTDDLAQDGALTALAERVQVTGDDSVGDMQAVVTLVAPDGSSRDWSHDLDSPQTLDTLEGKLRAKVDALLGDEAQALSRVLTEPLRASDLGHMLRTGE